MVDINLATFLNRDQPDTVCGYHVCMWRDFQTKPFLFTRRCETGTHVDIMTPRGEISKLNLFSLHLDINLTLTRGY
jgi:hypothetical protein